MRWLDSDRWLAAVLACALLACSDGIGTPLRRQAADQSEDDDSGLDETVDEGDGTHMEQCGPTEGWPASYAADEAALREAINALREDGVRCGDDELDALRPLRASAALQCSARLHSRDMIERDFTGRTNPDGDRPHNRMRAAGFDVEDSDESIVVGERDAAQALSDLLDDGDDCRNVGTRELTHIGIGRYEDRWTLDFARD
jgi:uncharacterized protein YkwD